MLLEAVGFAFLSAVNPTALLIGAAYLGSANPRKTVMFYLAGAIIMTAALGVIFLVAIRAGGLGQIGNRTPRYGLRLGLGVAALSRRSWWRGGSRNPRRPTTQALNRAGWPG